MQKKDEVKQMIYIKNTENYVGVTVYGDFLDFMNLYEALHEIVGEEDEWVTYEGARLRVLGVCYDLRHSFMGNREVAFVDNGLNPDIMNYLSIEASEKNVYYSFNVLWPELLFVTMALNDFIQLYAEKQAKSRYAAVMDFHNIWDHHIIQVRGFQAAVANCIKETISEKSVNRVLKMMNSDYTGTDSFATQYLDELNIKFINMDREKRKKNISIMAKRLSEQGEEYLQVKRAVIEAARKYNCPMTDIRVEGLEYPEIIDW